MSHINLQSERNLTTFRIECAAQNVEARHAAPYTGLSAEDTAATPAELAQRQEDDEQAAYLAAWSARQQQRPTRRPPTLGELLTVLVLVAGGAYLLATVTSWGPVVIDALGWAGGH